MTEHQLDCEQASALVSEHLDGTLAPGEQLRLTRHLEQCASCAALERELRAIVADARSLPLPPLTRDLWPDIAARLATPVLALPVAQNTRGRSPNFTWRHLSVAAALLVTLSAGVTWSIARSGANGVATPTVAAAGGNDGAVTSLPNDELNRRSLAAAGDASGTALPNAGANVPPEGGVTGREPAAATAASRLASAQPGRPVLGTAAPTAQFASNTGGFALDSLYGREIALLRTVAESQLGLLDSSTVDVVRRNLDIIDAAIRECRTALADDPNSGFLLDQLGLAYERKVDLLRRLALL